MSEVIFERENGEFHESDDAPRAEVDAGQRDDLMDRAKLNF